MPIIRPKKTTISLRPSYNYTLSLSLPLRQTISIIILLAYPHNQSTAHPLTDQPSKLTCFQQSLAWCLDHSPCHGLSLRAQCVVACALKEIRLYLRAVVLSLPTKKSCAKVAARMHSFTSTASRSQNCMGSSSLRGCGVVGSRSLRGCGAVGYHSLRCLVSWNYFPTACSSNHA